MYYHPEFRPPPYRGPTEPGGLRTQIARLARELGWPLPTLTLQPSAGHADLERVLAALQRQARASDC